MNESIVLSEENEEKFNKIYSNFSKSEPNAMRFSQFFQFLLDRCLVTNKTTFKHFYAIFKEATDHRISKQPPPPNNTIFEKIINKKQLIFLFNELGKFIYHQVKGWQDKLYQELLSDKLITDTTHIPREMIFDQINRKLLLENAISVMANYEDEIKTLFLIFVDENYFTMKKKQGKLLLTQRQVELQNIKMSAVSFVRFLKSAEILPHLLNIDMVQELLSKVVPPALPKQKQFYSKHFLIQNYTKDLQNPNLKHHGDPGLLLFEFQIMISRIAVETCRETDTTKKGYDQIINKFLSEYLNLRTNDEIAENKPLSKINKNHLNRLETYYKVKQNQEQYGIYPKEQIQHRDLFYELQEKEWNLTKQNPVDFDTEVIISVLQSELPDVPPMIEVKQEMPPPFPKKFSTLEKVTIGKQPPEKEAKQKGPAPNKKQAVTKKGDKEKKVFKFMPVSQQTKVVLGSENYFQQLATELDYRLKPLASIERGNIPVDPFPSLISEVLYPPEMPQEILPFIEAALNAEAEGLYALSIQNYHKGHEYWKQLQKGELKPQIEMYFLFMEGGVYHSAGRDDIAFTFFYNCRVYAEKLVYLNPDRVLPYCGMGEVFFNAEEYNLATRCYLKVREVREKILGLESVDTGTALNNLGCCFFMLDRNKQALSYFKIAHSILVSQLGETHERSQRAKQNITLCNKSFYANTPEFRKLWQVYEKDPYKKAKKATKKKKK